MSLEEEMRTTLNREADARTVPAPDVAGLILRGRARRRRRNVVRLGVGVVATVLVGATAFGVVTLDRVPTGSSRRNRALSPGDPRDMVGGRSRDLAPGHVPDVRGAGLGWCADRCRRDRRRPHWLDGDFPIVSDQYGGTYAGFGAYQPEVLAAGTGCEDDVTTPVVGKTPDRLAQQLAGLPRSTVLQEPCTHGAVRPSRHPPAAPHRRRLPGLLPRRPLGRRHAGDHLLHGRSAPVDVVIDFWVLDVGGEPLVIDQWHNVDAPPDLVDQAREARESITFEEDD